MYKCTKLDNILDSKMHLAFSIIICFGLCWCDGSKAPACSSCTVPGVTSLRCNGNHACTMPVLYTLETFTPRKEAAALKYMFPQARLIIWGTQQVFRNLHQYISRQEGACFLQCSLEVSVVEDLRRPETFGGGSSSGL